ncbi:MULTISPECIES: hypothetical protein [unclassified Pedobacter]|uniref:hypothetical protein n=1 Tax=unclassified Pedobacter TaxID=2628915 RepID=UPI00141FA270|nr:MULTISPECIES: hypothetical protein [unclassified Pedobacter]NII81713.1 hypothetical protein [Pedobacter sp. SG908]NMN35717.1 hypothetical protein [Pedobacter sp. SG918]
MKKGDYVYGYHYEIGTIPGKVVRVNNKTITFNDGFKNYTLSKSNVKLQSEHYGN